jgi:hypothetical protein
MLRPMLTTTGKAFRLAVLAAVLAAPLLASGRALAGVTLVMQRGNDPQSTLYIDNDKMRMENPKASMERTVIIDASTKKMVMLNDTEKTYTEMTQADIERIGAMMTARRAQMQEQMKSMPPEQRKKMEQMMGATDAKPRDLKFEKMGSKKTINGFACDMYRVIEDGKPKEEDCIAPWNANVLSRADFAGLRKFAEDMAKSMGPLGGGASSKNMFEQFDKFPGFPVSRHPLEGEKEDEVLKSIKRGSIPGSTFNIPAGYTKKELPMGMGMGMGMGGPHHGGPGGRPMPPN